MSRKKLEKELEKEVDGILKQTKNSQAEQPGLTLKCFKDNGCNLRYCRKCGSYSTCSSYIEALDSYSQIIYWF